MKKGFSKILRIIAKPIMGKGVIDRYFPFLIGLFQSLYVRSQKEEVKTVSIPLGLSMSVFTRDIGVGLPLIVKGYYEREQTKHFLSELKEDDVVLDIGAHVGYYALLAGKIAKKGMVFAFEPDPDTASLLRKNIKLNGLTNVEVIEAAVSDKEGELRFNSQKFNKGESGVSLDQGNTMVKSITLDNFTKNRHLERVSLIKMDIEGGELMALRGGINTIKGNGIRLYTEYNPRSIINLRESPQNYLNEIIRLGFSIKQIIDESRGKIIPYSKETLDQTLKHTTYVSLFCRSA